MLWCAQDTVPLLLAAEKGGADIIEVCNALAVQCAWLTCLCRQIGMPFSDPLADGPTIQDANTIALKNGITYRDVLDFVATARKQGLKAPVVLMGYVNPLIQYGEEKAVVDAKEAGVNGFIVVDLPLEEQPFFFKACRTHHLSFVPLIAPTTRNDRLPALVAAADSYIYCVSLTGITGARTSVSKQLPDFLKRVRSFTNLPLAVGFGVSISRRSLVPSPRAHCGCCCRSPRASTSPLLVLLRTVCCCTIV